MIDPPSNPVTVVVEALSKTIASLGSDSIAKVSRRDVVQFSLSFLILLVLCALTIFAIIYGREYLAFLTVALIGGFVMILGKLWLRMATIAGQKITGSQIPKLDGASEVSTYEWKRAVPIVDSPNWASVRDAISTMLIEIQGKVYQMLKDQGNDIQRRQVRVNVFLPDARLQILQDCALFQLNIPPSLQVGMDGDDNARTEEAFRSDAERQLRLFPWQGATGKVYMTGEAKYTVRNASNDWPKDQELSDRLKKLISKKLKWVVTLPIGWINQADDAMNARLQPIGVLNIDGLDFGLEEQTLTKIIGDCMPYTWKISAELRKLKVGSIKFSYTGAQP